MEKWQKIALIGGGVAIAGIALWMILKPKQSATLIINTPTVSPGGYLGWTIQGFKPNAALTITLTRTPTDIHKWSSLANADGGGTYDSYVGSVWELGTYTMLVEDTAGHKANASFVVA